jgi:hypothetical protein
MTTLAHPRSWLERRRARHEADVWIRRGFESRYPWRVAELTSARERRSCARCVRSVFDELEGRRLPGATPLQGRALVADVALLEAVERRLLAPEPVSARGMLAVNDLLTSPDSCLYSSVDDVAKCLRDVLENLEVH